MKKAKKFTFIVTILLFIVPIAYILLYHFIGTKEIKVSHSYKQFLLQYTKGARFIIDSGSNSIYSIEAYALEKEFGMQTINLSDSAAYPLSEKLIRIKKYLHKQDIILLPLEFQHYSRKKTHDIFTNNLLGLLNYYYNDDSMLDELKQMKSTPFKDFIKGIDDKYKFYKNQRNYLSLHVENFKNHQRGSSVDNKSFDQNIKNTCDQYVLSEQLKNGFTLSQRFKNNVNTIKSYRLEGYKIVFTWPVVVGDDCFSKAYKSKLDTLVIDIKNYLKQNDIPIIGDPYENKFLTKDIRDTYYHLNIEAKKLRTQRLIRDIKKSHIYKYISQKRTTTYEQEIKASKANMISLLDKNYKVKEKIDFKLSSVLFSGWAQAEKDFRWSNGKKSKITFKFSTKDINGILSLHVRTLGKQNIIVHINDQQIDNQLVEASDTVLKIKFNPKILKEINTISFDFPNAHQANTEDTRVLAMALIYFMIE